MGCDIFSQAEKRVGGTWQRIEGFLPFDRRDYGLFGFLAGVRNYSAVPPIAPPRGLPADADYEEPDDDTDDEDYLGEHSFSWLSVDELANFDYDQLIEDRRSESGGTCEPGEGKRMTYRVFLGDAYFKELDRLKDVGAERIVFGFAD